jgi:hypothetical protein
MARSKNLNEVVIMMRSKLMLTVLAFSILLGFTAAFAQTTATVTADQVKAALDKFTAARTEYQTLVRSGAEKAMIDAAYTKFTAAQAEYQQLNKAAGNCLTPGSGKQTNQNGNGQGSGLKKRDGSCGQSGTQSGASGAGKMQGKGKGRGGR